MSEIEDAFETLVFRKANLMRNGNRGFKKHLEALLQEQDIVEGEEPEWLVGAVDAMIYDVASALGLNQQASHSRRRELVLKIWRSWKGQRNS